MSALLTNVRDGRTYAGSYLVFNEELWMLCCAGWCRFTQVCACVLKDRSVVIERFCAELLPLLLTLSADPVPNVRIALARALANQVGQSST